jgi:hypothetical protein
MAMASKSNKLDNAISRARGEEAPADESAQAMTILSGTGDESITTFSPEELVKLLREKGYQSGERFLELQPGQMLSGYLTGMSWTKVQNPSDPRLVNDVRQWRFELDSGARVSHLGSAQLDRQLMDFPLDGGTHVVAAYAGKIATKRSRQMSEWFVLGKVAARKPTHVPPDHEDLMAPPKPTPAPAPAESAAK